MAASRIVFLGTPEFAVPVLSALLNAGHNIPCVYTQPPRPAGRGRKERRSKLHEEAARRGIELRTPATLKNPEETRRFAALNADVAVVVAYGLLIPPAMLALPRLGFLNLHPSLLPRWRGAAPIERAILAGDTETGVMIMQMDEGLDTGAILLRQAVPITNDATAESLRQELADVGAKLMLEALDKLAAGRLKAQPQPEEGATYAKKIAATETRIDWQREAAELARLVRALSPRPGAWFAHGKERIKALAAEVVETPPGAAPGTILDNRLTIACGKGALRLVEVQRAGRAALPAADFLRGYPLQKGEMLPLPDKDS
jgi:methionyl-tRNA formyltransferase